MQIDRATLADARNVAQIHVDAWRVAYAHILPGDFLAGLSVDEREAMWTRCIEAGRPTLLVAREQGTVRGWVAIGPCRDADASPSQAEVWAIYVTPEAWHQGIGRALWSQARQRIAAAGYTSCSLWVFPENEQAIRFYRSVGFQADLARETIEIAGLQLEEVRYACPIDG